MPFPPRIPPQLANRPFTLDKARELGLTRDQLRSGAWASLGRALYVRKDLARDPFVRIQAAALRLPPDAVFNERTSLWLHGLDVDPCNPIDALIVHDGGVSARAGVRTSRAGWAGGEIEERRGLRVTRVERALADLAGRQPVEEAVIVTDQALNARLTDLGKLGDVLEARAGRPGVRRLRTVLGLVDARAESPYETRLRLLLVRAGLAPPDSQVELLDQGGKFLARVDLLYRHAKLVLEFDGGWHRQNLVEDNRRQNLVVAAGYTVLRFTATDLHQRPDWVVAQVRASLAAASQAA